MNTKQVIVWRNDLKVRKGKLASQIAHASMAFLTREMSGDKDITSCWSDREHLFVTGYFTEDQYHTIEHWLENSFKKVVCYVNSEQDLLELFEKAKEKGMIAHLVEDNGATEFNGVKTVTCLSLGPDIDQNFEGLTNHLPLL